jgi:Stress responsive A/B Barrel Domain
VIRHVVVFKLAADSPADRARDAAEIRRRLEALVGLVPGVRDLEARSDLGIEGHWDVVLVTHHDTRDDLAAYGGDPRHREVVEYCDTVVAAKAVVDCDLES